MHVHMTSPLPAPGSVGGATKEDELSSCLLYPLILNNVERAPRYVLCEAGRCGSIKRCIIENVTLFARVRERCKLRTVWRRKMSLDGWVVRLVRTQPLCLHTAGAGRQGGESGAVIKSQIKPPPHVVARLSRKYVKELGRMRARKRKAAKAGFIADHKALVK